MFGRDTGRWAVLGLLIIAGTSILASAQQQTGRLQVTGYEGDVAAVRFDGRVFVELETLARVTGSSISFERDRVILTLPGGDTARSSESSTPVSAGFSRPFMSAAIEALASMREWGSTLVVAIQNGYPLGRSINPYRGRAADKVALAAAAVSTESDRSGMELLKREFANVQAWSDKLVNLRNSMSAGNLTMSENALQQDPLFQNIVGCGQHLGQMLASGSFQDADACR